jgi:hypothetical protein
MTGRTFGEELRGELAGKTVMWAPAIAGAVLLGPVGILLGLVASVAIVASGSDNSAPPSSENPPKN